jgi:hypothetical protein
MYYIYSEDAKGYKMFLSGFDGLWLDYTKDLAEQQLAIFEQLPYKRSHITWHMIKCIDTK